MTQDINSKLLKFDPENHRYTLEQSPIEFTSATTLLHKFFAPFDSEKIASNLVENHPKYQGRLIEDVLDDWKKSAEDGTSIHNAMEMGIIKHNEGNEFADAIFTTGGLDRDCTRKLKHGLRWLKNQFAKKDHLTLYPELMVYSEEMAIAGTMDLLVYNKEKEHYTIVDWKTNKAIRQQAFKEAKGMQPETAHLDDCNFIHYTLQLSLYRYILETYYGLKINNQAIVHLTTTGAVVYECEYLSDVITAICKRRIEDVKR
tara:strand:+ start:418 stop:1191 length:774 start_codon:yes stop_codon:yes gene_type:complete